MTAVELIAFESQIASDFNAGMIRAPKYSKKAPLPRCHPLVHELFARIDALGVPLKTIAARTGCTPHVLSRWKLRNRPKLDNFDEVLQSMGLKLAIVER